MPATFRIIKKPNPLATYEHIRSEVEIALKPVLTQHVKQYNDVVSDFDNKPVFEGRIATGSKQLEIQVILKNGGQLLKKGAATIADLVKWLFKSGVKAHDITPKTPGGILVFPWGGKGSYSRKTPTKGGSKGSGTVSGAKKTVAKKVRHPGFKPSDALARVNERLSRSFLTAAGNGVKKGLKRK